jgi:hypothetical protein
MFSVIFIQRFGFSIEEIGQCLDSACPTRWALVDVCLTGGNCLGIGMTACKSALATLCLRQQGVDLISHRIAFDLETYCGVSQQ